MVPVGINYHHPHFTGKKPSLSEVRELAQRHTAGKWGYWDLNPDSLDPESCF